MGLPIAIWSIFRNFRGRRFLFGFDGTNLVSVRIDNAHLHWCSNAMILFFYIVRTFSFRSILMRHIKSPLYYHLSFASYLEELGFIYRRPPYPFTFVHQVLFLWARRHIIISRRTTWSAFYYHTLLFECNEFCVLRSALVVKNFFIFWLFYIFRCVFS